MSAFDYILQAVTPFHLFLAFFGVTAGIAVGCLPGLTATMAVAVLVPITFVMSPTAALIMMGAVYMGSIYGGSYSAILLRTPGTPSAIATTFDGYPMAQKGDGDLAITITTIASLVGGLVGALALLTLSPPLATIALKFGPSEYFWLAVLGLTLISALSEQNLIKGLIGGCFGMLLSTVGVADVSADVRFTFGSQTLVGGIEVIAALIGLYCIPVIIDLASVPGQHLKVTHESRGFRLGEAFRVIGRGNKFNLIRSAVVGTFVGILPGAGGAVAGLVAYAEARRASKTPEKFGTGYPGGIIASEAANNATVGGGLVPTLVLGIPGTPPDAVILGALMIQGLKPGPQMFTTSTNIIYPFIVSLMLATVVMFPAGLIIGRYAYKAIVSVPKALLVPSIAFLTVIGTYAIRNNVSDVIIMIILGVVGWIFNRFGFSPSPIVLGVILGGIAERGFTQAWIIGSAKGHPLLNLFGRPISMVIIAFILLSFFYPFVAKYLRFRNGMKQNGDEAGETKS